MGGGDCDGKVNFGNSDGLRQQWQGGLRWQPAARLLRVMPAVSGHTLAQKSKFVVVENFGRAHGHSESCQAVPGHTLAQKSKFVVVENFGQGSLGVETQAELDTARGRNTSGA